MNDRGLSSAFGGALMVLFAIALVVLIGVLVV